MSFIETFKEGVMNDLSLLADYKYSSIILSMFVVAAVVSVVYRMNKSRMIIKKEQVNEPFLFRETINSLGSNEKKICKILNETEGIKEDYLMGKMNIDEVKLKKSLKLLEKRQIIKEIKSNNSKIYLSDWLR